jgi:hypothetical protein
MRIIFQFANNNKRDMPQAAADVSFTPLVLLKTYQQVGFRSHQVFRTSIHP